MDEILKKLLESDLLNEETKTAIAEQFKTTVDAYLTEERSKLEVEIRSTLTEEFVKARDELAENVNTRVDEFLNEEFSELVEDINKFRDLEVEYAEKLVEEKEKLAITLKEEIDQLVDKIDAFLEVRLEEEMSELKDDIENVKQLEFGRKIFEAVEAEYKKFRKNDLSTAEQALEEAQDKLADAEKRLADIESARLTESRNTKLEEILSPLSGNAREQMKIILSTVATEKLEEAYKIYIGRVLKESIDTKKDKTTTPVITEQVTDSVAKAAKLVTGNELTEEVVNEEKKPSEQLSRMRQLAGLK